VGLEGMQCLTLKAQLVTAGEFLSQEALANMWDSLWPSTGSLHN
jgi:hypothetical protein